MTCMSIIYLKKSLRYSNLNIMKNTNIYMTYLWKFAKKNKINIITITNLKFL